MTYQSVPAVLVDARNYSILFPEITEKIKNAPYTGVDIETHNGNAHEGIKVLNKKKNIFDIRRTVVTGISFYPEGDIQSYYINLNHFDVENRVSIEEVKKLLIAKLWIIHNASFELTMMGMTYGITFDPYICTLQMAVSAYGPDNYEFSKFCSAPLGAMTTLFPEISKEFENYDIMSGKQPTPKQAELIGQICGKQTDAAWSYNGWVKDISYGYNLKKAVKSFFDYDMEHYEDCLANSQYAKTRNVILKSKEPELRKLAPYFQEAPHMGHLTGQEVVSYGADDAYWCVQLYKKLLEFMSQNCPNSIPTFFTQENPMVKLYSKMKMGGLRISTEEVIKKREEERINLARVLKELKECFRSLLPFKSEPSEALMKSESWYQKNFIKYRQKIIDFSYSPDYDETPEGVKAQIFQINGGAANSYNEDNEGIINLSHYMPQRTIFYDLMGFKAIRKKGKLQSDADARGELLSQCEEGSVQYRILKSLNKLSQVDQVCKLYLNPYLFMVDPETGRVYPDIGSELATRRMAMSNPNGQQLAKRGESVYVRGFYLPDYDDHVIISSDWSNMELVIPAELSGDPEFLKCFSHIPYDDLHATAAAAMLDMTDEEFASLKHLPPETTNLRGIEFKNNKGELLPPKDFWKWARTKLGKGANFSYAFSGALATLQEELGWSDEYHWAKVEAYRNRFNVFEAWRLDTIAKAQRDGYIELPDGHRRYRLEATRMWKEIMYDKFMSVMGTQGIKNFFQKFSKLIQTRANNQSVNALVQGTAAALTKRSIKRLDEEISARGWGPRECRIMLPIHDEIVVSVHKDLAIEYRQLIREVMCNHPWLFSRVKLNCSVSMGRTFQPFNKDKAPFGQIELDEAPEVDFIEEKFWGKSVDDAGVKKILDYMFTKK